MIRTYLLQWLADTVAALALCALFLALYLLAIGLVGA
jgi:hypothetical protein